MHWVGAQFCVCIFLVSRDKFLNMLKFFRNDQRKRENKRARPCCRIRLKFIKYTVWPRNIFLHTKFEFLTKFFYMIQKVLLSLA